MRYLFFLLMPVIASAQIPRYFTPLPGLTSYLQLNDAQVTAILANNDEYNRTAQEKQARISQVQMEIAEQTAKDPLDPTALGVRYAEIESICRFLKDEATRLQKLNVNLLTEAQRVKLKALDDALKLYPIISEAQDGNVLGTFLTPPWGFSGGSSAVISATVGYPAGVFGCTNPNNGSRWFNSSAFADAKAAGRSAGASPTPQTRRQF